MAKKSFFANLKQFFGIASKAPKNQQQTSGTSNKVPYPGEVDPKSGKLRPVSFSDELARLYEFWLNDTYDTSQTVKDRQDRYESLQYAYYNSPIISATVDLYADEATQIDSQSKIIGVEAKNRQIERFITEFFDKIGVTQKALHDIAWNVVLFGDGVWVLPSSPEHGIEEIVPVDPMSLKDRFEFNAVEAAKKLGQSKFGKFINRNTNLKMIQKMMDESTDDFSKHFKNYLFGFQVESQMLPPWNVAHFRAFSTQSEFHPFGRPILINSLAPFRQLQTVKNLMALGRANSFDITKYSVSTDDNATPEDKWESVNEARQQMGNLSNNPSGKEQFTINSEIWVPQDLLDVERLESRFDPDKVGDVEMLRDDLIMGTRIPKGYLIVDRSSFGTSGQALLAQHKPFARAVYQVQSAILEQLAQIVRLQMVMTGKFDPDEAEFELTMPFPETEESQDRVRVKNDLLRLSKDIIDNLGDALGLGRDEALPPEVVKSIFSQFSFIDGENIDDWVDQVISAQEEEGEEDEDSGGGLFNRRIISGERRRRITERLDNNPNVIRECYFDAKRRHNYREGVIKHRHYISSNVVSQPDRIVLNVLSSPNVIRD